jgi:hypothetical protein
MAEADEKPILGVQPLEHVDEQRNRVDYNRAIEISQAIIRFCADETPWPPEWDDEMSYITEALWHRTQEGGISC